MVFLKYGYDFSLQIKTFLDPLNVEKVIPSFKSGDLTKISNCSSVSSLSRFSKILERIMHNCLYNYVINEKLLYPMQLDF